MRALLLLAALWATVAKESTFEAESSPPPRLASVSSPPPPPSPSPAALQPSRPSQTSATHPLTVLTEYQTFDEDVDAEGVRRAVSAALATLSRAVHLPGPEPLPLLLPRPCAVLQQWSSGNRNTKSGRSECIKARRCRSNTSVVAPDAAPLRRRLQSSRHVCRLSTMSAFSSRCACARAKNRETLWMEWRPRCWLTSYCTSPPPRDRTAAWCSAAAPHCSQTVHQFRSWPPRAAPARLMSAAAPWLAQSTSALHARRH